MQTTVRKVVIAQHFSEADLIEEIQNGLRSRDEKLLDILKITR